MISLFAKAWLTSTCAPDSIINVRYNETIGSSLDTVYNEDMTDRIAVLSIGDRVVSMGRTYSELNKSQNTITITEAISKVSEMFNLTHVNIDAS